MQERFYIDRRPRSPRQPRSAESFKEFDATELFCAKCGHAVPVRKRLLLVLPEGEKYEYLCAMCGSSVGNKIVRGTSETRLII